MYTKIINPAIHGKTSYGNLGSCSVLINYLNKENQNLPLPEHELFFDQDRNNITSHEVVDRIDNNCKGLTKRAPKFHSLVIAPDAVELNHIGYDTNKLKDYVRDVMDEYARNFILKTGQNLQTSDLVWYAKLERARNGVFIPDNIHIHVVVSARNKSQSVTLNPLINNRKRFNRVQFYLKNEQTFDRKFCFIRTESKLQIHQLKKNGNFEERLDLYSKKYDKIKLNDIIEKYPLMSKFPSILGDGGDEPDRKRRKRQS